MQNTKAHTWESERDVVVQKCELVRDVYAEILKEEKAGNIIIHRYAEIDPAEQKLYANYIRDHIRDEGETFFSAVGLKEAQYGHLGKAL